MIPYNTKVLTPGSKKLNLFPGLRSEVLLVPVEPAEGSPGSPAERQAQPEHLSCGNINLKNSYLKSCLKFKIGRSVQTRRNSHKRKCNRIFK